MLYEKYSGKWYSLTKDVCVNFTLSELYGSATTRCAEMSRVSGIDPNVEITLVAPKGFVTDLASIPSIFRFIGLTPEGPWEKAAIMHDLLYQKKSTNVPYQKDPLSRLSLHSNKDFADRFFLLMLRRAMVDPLLRIAMYKAVVTYGWGSYACPNLDLKYPIPENITFNPRRNYIFFRSGHEEAIPPLGKDPVIVNVQFPNIKRAFIDVAI